MKISEIYSEKKSLSFEIFPPKKTEDLEKLSKPAGRSRGW